MGKPSQEICTDQNISSSLKILNSELYSLDIPNITLDLNNPTMSLTQLINVSYELTALVKKNNIKINQQFEELLRAKSTLNRELQEKERLATRLNNAAGKVEDLKTKINSLESRITVLNKQVKTAKTDVSKLQHSLTTQKLHHEHETRRKDAIISGLKAKIYQSFSNESSLKDRAKAPEPNKILSSQYDEILDKYVCQLHQNIQLLLGEIAEYRCLLESLYGRLSLEILDIPGSTLVDLSGLPCGLVVAIVEKNFELFANKFFSD